MADHVWHVAIQFTEDEDRTRADVTLELAGKRFHAVGFARRAPGDPSVPVVGEDLAAARGLSQLSHELVQAAAERIEAFEGHPVRIAD